MTVQPTLWEYVPAPPSADLLDRLAAIMAALALERGRDGVTVARTLHVALARGESLPPAVTTNDDGSPNTRAASWRGGLGRRAGLVATPRKERVPREWFPDAHMNDQTVWVHPRFAA